MRTVDLAGGLLGAACLLAPARVARVVGGPDDSHGRLFLRVLGVRHLGQAALLTARPTRRTRSLGAAVDATHALSMLGFGLLDEKVRRPAYTNAAVATGSALLGWRRR